MEFNTGNKISFIPLNQIRGLKPSKTAPQDQQLEEIKKEKIQLKKACQDFESIFLFYLLKDMRRTIPQNEKAENLGLGSDVFTQIMDEQLAQKISETQSLGISDLLYQRLANKVSDSPSEKKEPKVFILKNKKINSPNLPSQGKRPRVSSTLSKFESIIQKTSQKYNLDPLLISAVIRHESGGNPKAVSSKGARGLMQLTDSTAQELGVRNAHDPEENVLAGAKYLRKLLDMFRGDLKLALAAYNAGPEAVKKYRGVPPFKETSGFVRKVLNSFR